MLIGFALVLVVVMAIVIATVVSTWKNGDTVASPQSYLVRAPAAMPPSEMQLMVWRLVRHGVAKNMIRTDKRYEYKDEAPSNAPATLPFEFKLSKVSILRGGGFAHLLLVFDTAGVDIKLPDGSIAESFGHDDYGAFQTWAIDFFENQNLLSK